MTPVDAVRVMLRSSGVTMMQAAGKMGKSQNFLTSALATGRRRGGGLNTATLAGAAAACGYALALVPVDRLPEEAVVMDFPEDAR